MFQMCSHVAHDTFKARAKAAGVPFLLLTRQSADWPRAFKQAGIELSLRPVDPTPLPAPDLPKKNGAGVIVANGAPLLPPPAPVIPDPKEAVPFGEALKAFRKRESAGQGVIADLCGVSQGLVNR